MSKTIHNQHYIPKCIQKQFSSNKKDVFFTFVEENIISFKNVKGIMTSMDTHEHPDLPENLIEIIFSKYHENDFIKVLREIEQKLTSSNINQSNLDAAKKIFRENLNKFVIMYYRSGALLHEYSFDHSIKNFSPNFPFSIPKNIPLEKPEKYEKVIHMINKLVDAKYLIGLCQTLNQYYNFSVIKSDDGDFILSDQYISTVALGIKLNHTRTSNRNLGLRDVMILIPISCNYYIVLYNGKNPEYIKSDQINVLDAEQIGKINEVIINNSYVEAIAKNSLMLENAKTKFLRDINSPISCYVGSYKNGIAKYSVKKKELFFYESDKKSWDMYNCMYMNNEIDVGIYKLAKPNDKCPCNSGLKFKKCCEPYFKRAQMLYNEVVDEQTKPDFNMLKRYAVSENATIEKSAIDLNLEI